MKVENTKHSLQRLEQRANITSIRDMQTLSAKAKMYGRSKADYDGDFAKFLHSHYREKSGNTRIKIYNGMVFIFGGNKSRKLITAVNVPQMYLSSANNPVRDTRYRAY